MHTMESGRLDNRSCLDWALLTEIAAGARDRTSVSLCQQHSTTSNDLKTRETAVPPLQQRCSAGPRRNANNSTTSNPAMRQTQHRQCTLPAHARHALASQRQRLRGKERGEGPFHSQLDAALPLRVPARNRERGDVSTPATSAHAVPACGKLLCRLVPGSGRRAAAGISTTALIVSGLLSGSARACTRMPASPLPG